VPGADPQGRPEAGSEQRTDPATVYAAPVRAQGGLPPHREAVPRVAFVHPRDSGAIELPGTHSQHGGGEERLLVAVDVLETAPRECGVGRRDLGRVWPRAARPEDAVAARTDCPRIPPFD
jgi:hypothetical protein